MRAIELMRDVVAQPALRQIVGKKIAIGAKARGKAEIVGALRAFVTSGHHPVSTCRIGPESDPGAVLDHQFRVRALEGLRVVDASAFPDQISGNPSAAIMMMAERAADCLLDRPPLPAASP